MIFIPLGSYKFIENTINFGTPLIHNLDNAHWIEAHRPTYIGPVTIYDINIIKLVKNPTVSDYTKKSYLLPLYGSFWYQYIPESNFKGNLSKFKYLGSTIYLLAIIPTLLFIIGIIYLTKKSKTMFNKHKKDDMNNLFFPITSVLLFIANLVLIVAIGIKYDVWSCFQSRLFFPSLFGLIILLKFGLEYIDNMKYKKIAHIGIYLLFIMFVIYFIIEIMLKLKPIP